MNSKEMAKQIINSIIATKEFDELKEAKTLIDRKRELRSAIESFQKKQMDIYQTSRSERELRSKLEVLNRNFSQYSNIPEVQKYIQAGERFNQMMGELNKSVDEGIQVELNK